MFYPGSGLEIFSSRIRISDPGSYVLFKKRAGKLNILFSWYMISGVSLRVAQLNKDNITRILKLIYKKFTKKGPDPEIFFTNSV
jgi:hypothetical protein